MYPSTALLHTLSPPQFQTRVQCRLWKKIWWDLVKDWPSSCWVGVMIFRTNWIVERLFMRWSLAWNRRWNLPVVPHLNIVNKNTTKNLFRPTILQNVTENLRRKWSSCKLKKWSVKTNSHAYMTCGAHFYHCVVVSWIQLSDLKGKEYNFFCLIFRAKNVLKPEFKAIWPAVRPPRGWRLLYQVIKWKKLFEFHVNFGNFWLVFQLVFHVWSFDALQTACLDKAGKYLVESFVHVVDSKQKKTVEFTSKANNVGFQGVCRKETIQ